MNDKLPDAPWIKEATRNGGFSASFTSCPGDSTEDLPVRSMQTGPARAGLIEAEAVAMSAVFDALMEPHYDPDEVRREFRVARRNNP